MLIFAAVLLVIGFLCGMIIAAWGAMYPTSSSGDHTGGRWMVVGIVVMIVAGMMLGGLVERL